MVWLPLRPWWGNADASLARLCRDKDIGSFSEEASTSLASQKYSFQYSNQRGVVLEISPIVHLSSLPAEMQKESSICQGLCMKYFVRTAKTILSSAF